MYIYICLLLVDLDPSLFRSGNVPTAFIMNTSASRTTTDQELISHRLRSSRITDQTAMSLPRWAIARKAAGWDDDMEDADSP